MRIICKSSKRFLLSINIEDYYKQIKKMGLDIKSPIIIETFCSKCKMIEKYEIYPTHYEHISSFKNNIDKNK